MGEVWKWGEGAPLSFLSAKLQELSSVLSSTGLVILNRKSEGPTPGISSYFPVSFLEQQGQQ